MLAHWYSIKRYLSLLPVLQICASSSLSIYMIELVYTSTQSVLHKKRYRLLWGQHHDKEKNSSKLYVTPRFAEVLSFS